jgi:peptidoglycan/LPS O-acetylase OafA/YrhL
MLIPEKQITFISPNFVSQFRKIADYTFPLYVLHMPILKLLKVIMQNKFNLNDQFYLSLFISIIVCVLLGTFFEKLRPTWSKFFQNIVEKIFVRFSVKNLKIEF